MESDIGIRLLAARIPEDGFLGPNFHEIPLDARDVGGEIHAVTYYICVVASHPSMFHINLVEITNWRLIRIQINSRKYMAISIQF